jgi:hypothetical protein
MELTNEKTKITGRVTVKRYKAGFIKRAQKLIQEKSFDALKLLEKEYFLGTALIQENLVVSSSNRGRNILCQWLAGVGTYAIGINYGEMGTGNTAPLNSDTALTTPVKRVAPTTYLISNNVLTFQFFFSDAVLPNNTYHEFGTYIAGSSTLGSGQLFNHALFSSPYIKASGEDTTIEVDFTIT